MDKQALRERQLDLAQQVRIPQSSRQDLALNPGDWVFTTDVQYQGDIGAVAVDVLRWPNEPVGTVIKTYEVTVPYAPGFFAFREGPLLVNALEDIAREFNRYPKVIITDGHGTNHPRQFGLACWLGVTTGYPVIGLAKDTLLPYTGELPPEQGAALPVLLDEKVVGHALRTRKNVKPVFVSAGHKVSQGIALETVKQLMGQYRNIEPMRRADQAARQAFRG
ncbi:endonuclease V [Phaeodactylibacter xiamenensis]|uniref:endonuclease V n=1 Tax=Phaeodactylibacter xiamenensis TaxID=1524460 RepID=UPI0024A8C207|nr:endonuclease V [Phaeodactylibacter xiamenensis]